MDDEAKKLLREIRDELRVIRTAMVVQLPSGIISNALEKTCHDDGSFDEYENKQIWKVPLRKLTAYLCTGKVKELE